MTDPLGRAERSRRSQRGAPFTVFGDIRVLGSLLMTAPDGTQHVVTLANDGTLATTPDDTAPLPASGVTPGTGAMAGPTDVTITGTGLASATGVSIVDGGAEVLAAANVAVASDSLLTATIPAGSTASPPVTANTPMDVWVTAAAPKGSTVIATYAGAFSFTS